MKLPYPLYWAGSSLEFTFTGSELHLTFDAGFTQLEPWISAELNGAPLLRMPLERGASRVCLFRGMTPGVPRHIRVFKETQPITGDPLHRLEAAEVTGMGGKILPPPPKALCLEFVGDSLTSGEGLAGDREETDWASPFFSASQSWARRTADLLQADFRAVSQSGWCGPTGCWTTLSGPSWSGRWSASGTPGISPCPPSQSRPWAPGSTPVPCATRRRRKRQRHF